MLIDKGFILNAKDCYKMEREYAKYSDNSGTIYIVPSIATSDSTFCYSIENAHWYTRLTDSFYDYWDSPMMLCHLRPLSKEETLEKLEFYGALPVDVD